MLCSDSPRAFQFDQLVVEAVVLKLQWQNITFKTVAAAGDNRLYSALKELPKGWRRAMNAVRDPSGEKYT